MKGRLLCDFARDDTVQKPTGRLAVVSGLSGGRVQFKYDDGDEGQLLPHLLELIEKAKPKAFPRGFFNDVKQPRHA